MINEATIKPTRPILRYHGGKWLLADWVISHFPSHRIYVEPFGGAASVLLQKERTYSETYNDLNNEVVNLFQILRDRQLSTELFHLIRLTPFSRVEFELSKHLCSDPMEQARRTMVRYWFGISPHGAQGAGTSFRSGIKQTHRVPAQCWRSLPEQLEPVVERLRGVTIEHMPATDVMLKNDTPDTLHYCDPPYPNDTRSQKTRPLSAYQHEMSDDEHRELSRVTRQLKGMVIVSGYPCRLYDEELYSDWHRVERPHLADGARPRTEVLWLNASAHKNLNSKQSSLFADE